MKSLLHFAVFFTCLLSAVPLTAQNDNPVDYMNLIEKAEQEANQKYLAYVSTAAHSGRVRKIEKMRQQLIDGINNSRNSVIGLPLYKGDNALRQASTEYLKMLYNIFTEDYAKIVNLEEIAEQSFNEMQAYLLLQEKAGEKLDEANKKRQDATKEFAKKYNINLVSGHSETAGKMNTSSKVIEYRNKIYLLFFKCQWQWGEMNKAVKNGKINDIEQARNAVITYAKEGLAILDTTKHYAGDPTLANTCKYSLNQYKRMAETDMPKLTDFLLKSENFEKVKKSFDAKAQRDRTQQDVDNYNKAVNEMNAAVSVFNNTSKTTTEASNKISGDYQKADKDFADKHTPYFKK